MSLTPKKLPAPKNTETEITLTPSQTILRGLTGSLVAATLSAGLYGLTSRIAVSFASKPIANPNITAQNIGAAVRTLVLGLGALGTFIFGFAALGLFLLALQTLFQQLFGRSSQS